MSVHTKTDFQKISVNPTISTTGSALRVTTHTELSKWRIDKAKLLNTADFPEV